MLTLKEQEKREKMKARLKKIKYRLYQAEIQFASHDNERLLDTLKRIRINSRKITELLMESKTTVKKTVIISKNKK